MKFFDLEFNNTTYAVTRTAHLHEARDEVSRSAGINPDGFKSILLEAFKQGLTQHRNSKIVITFVDNTSRRISILLELYDNKIEIISAFRNWKRDDFKANYITVKNRLNMMYNWMLAESGDEGNTSKKLVLLQDTRNVKTRPKIRKVKR